VVEVGVEVPPVESMLEVLEEITFDAVMVN